MIGQHILVIVAPFHALAPTKVSTEAKYYKSVDAQKKLLVRLGVMKTPVFHMHYDVLLHWKT
jgi:hypothetical protein